MSKYQKITVLSQNEELLTALDLFDLDESVIDDKLNEVMRKTDLKMKHFNIIASFIKYKYIICIQEETDCENDTIIQFALKQITTHLNYGEPAIFATLLDILSISLSLNKEKLQANIEHIMQQVLSLIETHSLKSEQELSITVKYLDVLNAVLDVSISNKILLEQKFINDDVFRLLYQQEQNVKMILLSKTIPKVLQCCDDSNILNIIWERISTKLHILNLDDFVMISALSDYYFPSNGENVHWNFLSTIVQELNFWKFIQIGIIHDDYSVRKCSIFLAKRAIEYSSQQNESFVLKTNKDSSIFFEWNAKKKLTLEKCWSNYFVLIETLEEKQVHLVLSAMHIFENLGYLPPCWLNLALQRALLHESHTVKMKSVEKVLLRFHSNQVYGSFPYVQLLKALNTISFYENALNYDINKLIPHIKWFLSHGDNLKNVIENINSVDWSPIPKFYICFSMMSIGILRNNLSVGTISQMFQNQSLSAQNNLYIRYGTQNSLTYFVMNQLLAIPNIVNFLHLLQSHIITSDLCRNSMLWNDIVSWVKRIKFDGYSCEPITDLLYIESWKNVKLSDMHARIKMVLIFVDSNIIKRRSFVDLINENIDLLNEASNRQYADPTTFDQYFFFIISTLNICSSAENWDSVESEVLLGNLAINYDSLINFLLWRFHALSPVDDQDLMKHYMNSIDILLSKIARLNLASVQANRLMKSSVSFLSNSDVDYSQKYISMGILSEVVLFFLNRLNWQKEENSKLLHFIIDSCMNLEITGIENKEWKGKITSNYKTAYSKICYYCYEARKEFFSLKSMEENVSNLLQTGGYGCLLWSIKITQLFLPELLNESSCKAHTLVNRLWTEVFDVRKNEKFKICIVALIEMIFQKKIFKNTQNHDIVITYADKIFELGELSPFVVQEFMKNLVIISKDIKLNLFVELLSKAILFGTVSRKDQRIEMDTCVFIKSQKRLDPPTLKSIMPLDIIRTSTFNILLAQDLTFHNQLCKALQKKLDAVMKNKNRYHGNSIYHRIILRILQTLLMSYKLYPNGSNAHITVKWCIAFLTKQPHHASARIMLEWYISLYFIQNRIVLSQEVIEKYQLPELPQLSLFLIIYHIVKNQLNEKSECLSIPTEEGTESRNVNEIHANLLHLQQNNFHFAMDLFMLHTMGQLFSVRLHAQFLSLKLYASAENIQDKEKYHFMVDTIKKTFQFNIQEKSFLKIQENFFINNFDAVCNLSLVNIYYHIPRLTGVSVDEWVSLKYVQPVDENMKNKYLDHSMLSIEDVIYDLSMLKTYQTTDCSENTLTEENIFENVQKKYVPWRNMLEDLGISVEEESEHKTSGLIVVASLIDRMPNLGGLARTCEVFGVKKYIIDNLRHTQDKIFKNLSVSSERWVDIEEIKPGLALKNYLIKMKEKGYCIIGVEQTSSSISLNKFNFPENTVLLLGHEKEGVPSNLLSLMDYCVEIPQHGKIRSLNVHVTASIFIWEYGKQHPIS